MVQGQLRTPGSTCSRSKKDFSAGKRGFLFSTPPWILDPSDGGRGQRVWEWDRPLPACGFKHSNGGNNGQRREGAICLRLWELRVSGVPDRTQPHTGAPQQYRREYWGKRGLPWAQGQRTHLSAQRRGIFRSLGNPKFSGPRTGPHPCVSLRLGRSK